MNYPLLYKINCPNSKQQAYSTVFRYQQLRSLSKRFSLVVVGGGGVFQKTSPRSKSGAVNIFNI